MKSSVKGILFLALFTLSAAFVNKLGATHLMGGSMTYLYQGMVGTDHSYLVTLKIYRYCDATGGGTAPLDFSAMLGIYDEDPANPLNDKNWFRTETLPLISSAFITPPSPGINCPFNTTVCVEEGIYEATILLPSSVGGYHLIVERCCRNGNIINLSAPGSIGQSYYCFIPANPIINSSPQFNDIPVPYICAGDLVTLVNNAVDPDGDSLVYSFELPYSGYSGSFNPVPDPQIDNNPYGWPIPGVIYNPGYSVASPFGAGGVSTIDINTGLTTYNIPNQGFFVVVVEIKEYRNGVLIAAVRRDLQLISIACPVNAVPNLSTAGGAGQINFVINEGQTLCFPVAYVDPNGDSLYLTSSGNIFNIAFTNPPAVLPNANGNGFVTSQFCWSTECGMAQSTPYQFVVSVIDNGCPPKIRNQIYSIKVNPSPIPPAPAVSIVQDPPGPICVGTAVTFTAIPTFGGTNPVYQWQLNGVNVGVNSNTWSSSTLNNGDVITVSMTSNSVCVNVNNAISPPVVMVVNPFAAPLVSISAVPAGPVCAGTNVTFTALGVNPGSTPTYQWTVDGVNVGTNSAVFSSSTLVMGNVVGVTLSSDPACPAAASNTISMTINPVITPSLLITGNNSGSICPGQTVNFQAYPTGGGATPSYQWQVNGVNVGTNSNLFSSSALNNGDIVSAILTSSEVCVSAPTAPSNVINITVTTLTNPSVTISANPAGAICKGDNIIFTATPVNAGSLPAYQWQVNGVNVFSGSNIFATDLLNDGDQVSVTLTSSLTCLNTNVAVSNVITVTVNPIVVPSVNISVTPGAVFCDGTAVTFTATPVNEGPSPAYRWQINGVNIGAIGAIFSTSTLSNQDKIRVVLTSSANCVSPLTATSNQITVTVLPIVNPTVSVTQIPTGPVCAGTNITFTASPLFGGPAPVFQWTVNGAPVGTNSSVFSSATLADGDIVRVSLTSSNSCPVPPVVLSAPLIMDINPVVTPSATISVNPSFPICDGETATFTSVVTNEGPAPVYQWQINGVNVASGSSTYTSSSLNNGDVVRMRLISNAVCAQPAIVISNELIAQVNPNLTPQVNILTNTTFPVCDGDSVSLSAVAVNGGATPSFQWLVNGLPTLTGVNTFTDIFTDQDVISVVLTSSLQCALPATDTSNLITVSTLPNLTPGVSITVDPAGPVCPGDLLTFTSATVNGGGAPVFQWMVNGTSVGTSSAIFSSSNLQNGDIVSVTLNSSEQCLTTPSANSNTITVQVSPNIQPDISIVVNPVGSVCDGDTLSFSVVFTGGGPTPSFAWRVNGVPNGITTAAFVTNNLNNGDQIDVVLTSSAFCALPVNDTSNVIIAQIDPLLSPSVVITADPPGVFCDGAVITYSAAGINGGLAPGFSWLLNGISLGITNDTVITSNFLDGDTLQAIYTSSERCLAFNPALSNLIIIDRHPPLQPVITATAEICRGEEAVISVLTTGGNGGPYTYSWSNGLGSDDSYTIIPLQTLTYTVTVSDFCSTPRTDTVTINVNPLPEVQFSAQPLTGNILNPYFSFVDLSADADSWSWNFGDGNSSINQNASHLYADPGVYTVWLTAANSFGCIDSTSREIVIEDVVTYYIPNSFTPNGDGINDLFAPVGNALSGYEMTIYNRWGQIIYSSTGPKDSWDGTDVSGNEVQTGLYIYTLKVNNDPEKKSNKGTVTLVR